MNPLTVLTAADVMEAGASDAPSVDAEMPVKEVMARLRDGATELAVTQAGRQIGVLRPASVMGRLLDPQRGAER